MTSVRKTGRKNPPGFLDSPPFMTHTSLSPDTLTGETTMAFLASSIIAPYAALVVMATVCYLSTMGGTNHITGRGK